MTGNRSSWPVGLGLGALGLMLVAWTAAGPGPGRMTQEAALEHCRAEVTRGLVVTTGATGHRAFEACMEDQGY